MKTDQSPISSTAIYNGWLMAIATALLRKGADPHVVFSRAGMDYQMLAEAEASSPLAATTRLWREAVIETGNEAFGLAVSSCIHATTFHALGFRFQCCSSPLDMLETLVKYQMLISNVVHFSLKESSDKVTLFCSPSIPQSPSAPEAFDATTALIVKSVRRIATNKPQAQQVFLTREPPKSEAAYKQVFNCNIYFGEAVNSVSWNRDEMDGTIPSCNPKLAKQLDLLLETEIRNQYELNVSSQVEALLMELLPYGEPSQERVSKQLNMSLRTLQRKLEKENTSYQAIVDSIRHHLAVQYLPVVKIPICEISGLLGFKDQSSFTRWFKVNFDESPSSYRRKTT